MKVEIQSITNPDGRYARIGYDEFVRVLVDGKELLLEQYGSEPEDNCRGRDYSWVEKAFVAIAKSLGAEVEVTKKQENIPW